MRRSRSASGKARLRSLLSTLIETIAQPSNRVDERLEIVIHGRLDDGELRVTVAVRQEVAHSSGLPPRNVRRARSKVRASLDHDESQQDSVAFDLGCDPRSETAHGHYVNRSVEKVTKGVADRDQAEQGQVIGQVRGDVDIAVGAVLARATGPNTRRLVAP